MIPVRIKTVSRTGQITLGARYAGQDVMIDEIRDGVWIIKIGHFVPRSEAWLYDPGVAQALEEAARWSGSHPRKDTDLDALERRWSDDNGTP